MPGALNEVPAFKVVKRESGIPIYAVERPFDVLGGGEQKRDDCTVEFVDKKEFPGVFVVRHLLSLEECERLCTAGEGMGFEDATITTSRGMVMNREVRNNQRVILQLDQDDVFLSKLHARLKPHVPAMAHMGDRFCEQSNWKIKGLNERLRFYRYGSGARFAPHYDGCFRRSSEEVSFLTLIVYLSDDFEGGSTTFFKGSHSTKPIWPWQNDSKTAEVVPRAGDALLFWHGPHRHSPLHEGSLVTGGRGKKYVLRSDVIYTRCRIKSST